MNNVNKCKFCHKEQWSIYFFLFFTVATYWIIGSVVIIFFRGLPLLAFIIGVLYGFFIMCIYNIKIKKNGG